MPERTSIAACRLRTTIATCHLLIILKVGGPCIRTSVSTRSPTLPSQGWEWRTFRNRKWPAFWVTDGPEGSHRYKLRTVWEELPMQWARPPPLVPLGTLLYRDKGYYPGTRVRASRDGIR